MLDKLDRVKRYVEDQGLGEFGFMDPESIECSKIIELAKNEIMTLKQVILDEAAVRGNWQNLVKELETKLTDYHKGT